MEVSILSYPLSKEPGTQVLGSNISAGGICFFVQDFYEDKTMLNLKIRLKGWQGYKKPFSRLHDIAEESPLTAIGEVAWCRASDTGSGFYVGLRFVNIYEDDYKALTAYISKQHLQDMKKKHPVKSDQCLLN